MDKHRILIVDDEPAILRSMVLILEDAGFTTETTTDGGLAIQSVQERPPDLILMDVSMPGVDGFETCRRIRQISQVPIIMLSANNKEKDKVKCLQLGADDYIQKPFGIAELLARVEAVLRRSRPSVAISKEPDFASGDLYVNFSARRVAVAEKTIHLTPTEFSLLEQLIINRGKVLTHRMLLSLVWGPEYIEERDYLRVYVNRLRHKIGDDPAAPRYITTDQGVGYHFLASSEN